MMVNSFLEYYRFNTKIAPDRTILQMTKKKCEESFSEYAKRWCELAAQVLPIMMEDEIIKWFIDNLKPPYYEKMINAQVTNFANLIPIGEHINRGNSSEKTINLESLSSMIEKQVKKATSHKGKEADVHMDDKVPERLKVITSTYTALTAQPY